MSNFLKYEPLRHAKRYDRKGKKIIAVEQLLLIHEYKQRMVDMDLLANTMNSIKIRGKKWYWLLLMNAFDVAMLWLIPGD